MPVALSAVIIAKNEAHQIERCIKAVLQVTADVVVVDSGSTDGTVEIARSLGAKVVVHEWIGYAQNKNYGNTFAQHDWILSVDADEVLSEALIGTIQQLELQEKEVYLLDRLNNYCGKWVKHSGWYPDWKIRIFNRNQVSWLGQYVHETLAIPAHFKEVKLSGKLLHYSYQDKEDHLKRIDRYSTLGARQLFDKGKKATWTKLWLSPLFRFVRTYIFKAGFLDGATGWTISIRNAYMVHSKYKKLRTLYDGKKNVVEEN